MKRKVQAQRKFAQGAYIPPHNNNITVDRRPEILPGKEPKNVIHHNMSPKELLDIISLRTLLVRVDRLEGQVDSNIIRPKPFLEEKRITLTTPLEKPTNRKAKSTKTRQGRIVKPSKKIIPKLVKGLRRDTQISLTKRNSMRLRSQTRTNNEPIIHLQMKKRKIPAAIRLNTENRKKLRHDINSVSDFSNDDDKPLKFFAKSDTPAVAKKKKTLQVTADIHPIPGALGHNKSPTKALNSNADPSGVNKHKSKDKVTTGQSSQDKSEDENDIVVENSSPDTNETRYYTNNGIDRWIDNSDKNKSLKPANITVEPTFKIPAPPKITEKRTREPEAESICNSDVVSLVSTSAISEIPESVGTSQQSETPTISRVGQLETTSGSVQVVPFSSNSVASTQCPSAKFFTVKEVIRASNALLDSRCGKCSQCLCVNKAMYFSKFWDKRHWSNAIGSRKNGRMTRQSAVSSDGNEHLYLDLLPENIPRIIQITVPKTPKQAAEALATGTCIMSARLVPRTKAQVTGDIQLVQTDILDQLIKVLSMGQCQVNLSKPPANEPPANKLIASKPLANKLTAGKPPVTKQKSKINARVKPIATLNKKKPSLNKDDTAELPQKSTTESKIKKTFSKPSTSKETVNITEVPNEPAAKENNYPERTEEPKVDKLSPNLLDAPIFYPTEKEFLDPLSYIESIMPTAAKFGLCKIVPPKKFKPGCNLNDKIRFNVTNQYISRLYCRWGSASREMCAIKAYLASQSVQFSRSPLLEGLEVNLPKLYHLVQRHGGLKRVIEKKRWGRVAEEMRLDKGPKHEKKLDQLYVKYLLPYDTLSHQERQQLMVSVEKRWNKKNAKLLERALNPLHRQKRLLGESESSDDETEEEDDVTNALAEAEDCVVSGRNMNLGTFKKVAKTAMDTLFPGPAPPTVAEVEREYWRLVLLGTDHVCVNTASMDTGEEGYGFTKNRDDKEYRTHAWNLKMMSHNSANMLRFLGPVLGVTVPTLHLGMVFSTSCWHRDPHGLPWIEYMHSGPGKIWYGIPDDHSGKFRKAIEALCPTSCQNKSIWLPSDITMIPPNLLHEHNVLMSRVVQKPGEFIVVFPKAYSCSISAGYTETESVYFATNSWLNSVHQVFQETRQSCEPTMISLEHLLIEATKAMQVPLGVLQQVHASLSTLVNDELNYRRQLVVLGLEIRTIEQVADTRGWNARDQEECEICRSTLYLSKVTGLTGRRSSVCLLHALRLLESQKTAVIDNSDLELITSFPCEELELIMSTLQARLF